MRGFFEGRWLDAKKIDHSRNPEYRISANKEKRETMHNADIKAFALSKVGQDPYDLIAGIVTKSCIFDRLQHTITINKELIAIMEDDTKGYYDIEDFLKLNDNHLYISNKTIIRVINYMRWWNFVEEYDGGPWIKYKYTCWTNIFAYFDMVYDTVLANSGIPIPIHE